MLRTAALAAALALGWPLACQPASAHEEGRLDPQVQVSQMRRGVNILGYDPLWKPGGQARFQARHFAIIRQGGFETVRIALEAFAHMDAQNRLDPAWLAKLDGLIAEARKADLNVILDEHNYNDCGQHLDDCRPRLLAFWRQIGARYRDQPAGVMFELLNEPNRQLTAPAWNALLAQALAVVRETNPTRNVVIGPVFWNSPDRLKDLDLPEADRHIIVTVHYYAPMEFTHQGASWNEATAHLSGVTWGSDADLKRLDRDFDLVQAWSQAHKRPILLGEFGAYEKGDMASRARYTAAAARAAEARGWAWADWQFDSDFVVWDMAKDQWVEPIRRALIPWDESTFSASRA